MSLVKTSSKGSGSRPGLWFLLVPVHQVVVLQVNHFLWVYVMISVMTCPLPQKNSKS